MRQRTASESFTRERDANGRHSQLGHGALADLVLGEVVDVVDLEERIALEFHHELFLQGDLCLEFSQESAMPGSRKRERDAG